MRAVRQRNPTWALRCPAFPSLKYYSVRVERGERENRAEPLAREPSPPFSRHYQRTLATPSSRASHARSRSPRGCFVARTYVLLFIFFRSLSYVRKSQVPFVYLSVRSFVCSFISRGQSKSKTKKGAVSRRQKTLVVTRRRDIC